MKILNKATSYKLQATRRRFLHSLAIFGMAMVLAGCPASPSPNTGGNNNGGTGKTNQAPTITGTLRGSVTEDALATQSASSPMATATGRLTIADSDGTVSTVTIGGVTIGSSATLVNGQYGQIFATFTSGSLAWTYTLGSGPGDGTMTTDQRLDALSAASTAAMDTFAVVATDNDGATNTTAAITITVMGADEPLILDATGSNADDGTAAAGVRVDASNDNRFFEIASGTATVSFADATQMSGVTLLQINISPSTYYLNGDTSTVIDTSTIVAGVPQANDATNAASNATHLALGATGFSGSNPTGYGYLANTLSSINSLTDGHYYILGTLNLDFTTPSNSTFTANRVLQE